MVAKLCVSVLVASVLAFSQAQVDLSGTVKDAKSGAPVSGASVALRSLAISGTTDSDGRFALSGAAGLKRGSHLQGTPNPLSLSFRQESREHVVVRILDLSGHERATVFSGELESGVWEVAPPSLPAGVYFCSFESPRSRRSVRFLSQADGKTAVPGGTGVKFRQESDGVALRSTAAVAVDSLIVEKSGYRTAKVPLAEYRKSGLEILLEDTGTVDAKMATIVPDPSWPCYMPDGIPPPSLGTAVFGITLQIGGIHDVGLTKFGKRRQYDIRGGSVSGDKFSGTVLTGALDYDLTLSNGSVEIEQIVIIKAGNTPILMRNAGVAPVGVKEARMVLDFEAPNSSSYAWLNTGKFAAVRVVDTAAKTIRLDVYDISKVTLPAARVQIKDPAGATNQTWDCVTLTGGQGASVFTETVTLGSSVSIGASKRGSRNIIPITGGTTSGKVVGKILDGGADYQLSGLDARYTLAPNDGEFIIVRNCGANGLVPVFEARVDGPYAYLNEVKYLSSSPNMVGSGVSITFYEKK